MQAPVSNSLYRKRSCCNIKKGFTLIELLAVIVILAIIGLIAVPIVINIIEDVRVKKNLITFDNVVKGSKLYFSKNQLYDKELKTIELSCDGNNCLVIKAFDANNKNILDKLDSLEIDLDGEVPSGNITLYFENNQYTIRGALYLDGYCKKNDSNKIEKVDKSDCVITTDDFCFQFNESNGTIKNYKCYEGNTETCNGISPCPVETEVVIPKKINNVYVKEIGTSAFSSKKLTKLDLSVATELEIINTKAFYNNAISGTLDLSHTKVKEIRNQAFYQCQELTKVIFPKTLEIVGDWAFRGEKIAKVDFSESTKLKEIGTYAFSKSPIEGELDLSHTSLTKIGYEGFAYSRITKLKLPSTLTTIGAYAFCVSNTNYSYYESIIIPDSVVSIGKRAFNGMYGIVSKEKSVTIESNAENSSDRFCDNWDDYFGTGAITKSTYCE